MEEMASRRASEINALGDPARWPMRSGSLSRRTSHTNQVAPRPHHLPSIPSTSTATGTQPQLPLTATEGTGLPASPSASKAAAATAQVSSSPHVMAPTKPRGSVTPTRGGGAKMRLRAGLGAAAIGGGSMKPLQVRTTKKTATASTSVSAAGTPALHAGSPTTSPHEATEGGTTCPCRITPPAFLRGVEVITRMFASATNPAGVVVPHTDVWGPSHALGHDSGSSHTMQCTSAPLLPITLITDGASLVIVDRNGSSHHGNYKALFSPPRTPRQSYPAGAPDAACWVLDALRAEPMQEGRAASDVVSAAVAKAAAWSRAAHDASETCQSHTAGLQSVNSRYGSRQSALVVLIRDRAAVKTALHDVCHCYVPNVLQSVYADGVPLQGMWVVNREAAHNGDDDIGGGGDDAAEGIFLSSSPLWVVDVAPSLTAESTSGTSGDATHGAHALHQLYPSMQREAGAAMAAAQLGHLALPEALVRILCAASPSSTTATMATAGCGPTPHTPPRVPGDGRSRRGPLPRSPHASAQSKTASPEHVPSSGHVLGGAPHTSSRLLLASSVATSPESSGPPPASTTATTEAAPNALSDSPWGARGDQLYYGTYTPTGQSTKATPLCTSVLLYTPRGRVELECVGTEGEGAVVTVHDVKEGFVRCALGRSLRLRRDQFKLVYAPGLPALPDTAQLSTAHAVLRLVRIHDV